MISLWISIVIVSLFLFLFVIFSVNEEITIKANRNVQTQKVFLIFPVIFILLAPVFYMNWTSYQQQKSWNQVIDKTEVLKTTGNISSVELSVQELILGLRTEAFNNPTNGELWFRLGKAYANLQMQEAAIASWQRAIRLGENPDWKVALAQLLAGSSEPSELAQAVNLLVHVVNNYPKHQSGLLTLGFTYFKLERYTQAIKIWQQLKSLDEISDASKRFLEQQINEARQKMK